MSIDIRRATRRDLELVIDRRLQFLGDVRGIAQDQLDPQLVAATTAFIERTFDRAFFAWLALDDDEVLGIVSLVVSDAAPLPEDLRSREGEIVNMHVEPASRGRGVGRRLLSACLNDGTAMGVRGFSLRSTDDGRRLYESAGFAADDTRLHRRS